MHIRITSRLGGSKHHPIGHPVKRAYFKSERVARGVWRKLGLKSRLYTVNNGYLVKWWD